jgi:type I restriction enzyme S subunit
MVALLEERTDSLIRRRIGESALAHPESGSSATQIKRVLSKLQRPAMPGAEMATAFRDGQVTARSLRRADGYTLSWTEKAQLQGVRKDDVVIHGLDGFAGAIGASEIDGVCSPVYHVCAPRAGGDSVYLGRLLRILAVSGYLGLFASSTRERAVDFRNWDLFGRIPIPDVHSSEQREIGNSIRKILPLKVAVERSAELASEYRQALITAAVTGQIDIPGVARAG